MLVWGWIFLVFLSVFLQDFLLHLLFCSTHNFGAVWKQRLASYVSCWFFSLPRFARDYSSYRSFSLRHLLFAQLIIYLLFFFLGLFSLFAFSGSDGWVSFFLSLESLHRFHFLWFAFVFCSVNLVLFFASLGRFFLSGKLDFRFYVLLFSLFVVLFSVVMSGGFFVFMHRLVMSLAVFFWQLFLF